MFSDKFAVVAVPKNEPLCTFSSFNFVFTFESKFVIVFAFTCADELNTLSPFTFKNPSESICADEDTTESPFISKNLLYPLIWPDDETMLLPCKIWDEPLITFSAFNLSFTLLSKLVIVLAFTCTDELNTLSPSFSKNLLYPLIWADDETTLSPFISKNLLYPLIWADEDTTESPFISKNVLYPLIWADELTTLSPFISKKELYPLIWADEEIMLLPGSELTYKFLYFLESVPKSCVLSASGIREPLSSALIVILSFAISSPNIILPFIVKSFATWIYDADTVPLILTVFTVFEPDFKRIWEFEPSPTTKVFKLEW